MQSTSWLREPAWASHPDWRLTLKNAKVLSSQASLASSGRSRSLPLLRHTAYEQSVEQHLLDKASTTKPARASSEAGLSAEKEQLSHPRGSRDRVSTPSWEARKERESYERCRQLESAWSDTPVADAEPAPAQRRGLKALPIPLPDRARGGPRRPLAPFLAGDRGVKSE